MKSATLLLSLLALGLGEGAPLAYAQNESAPPPPQDRRGTRGPRFTPEQVVARIDQAVGGLTADQKAKLIDIVTKTRDQMQALTPEERREKWREVMQQQNEQIRAVLTPDQQKKFDDMPRLGHGGGSHDKS